MRYAIWDKVSDIYTIGMDEKTGKLKWSAQDYIDSRAPWAANPNAKVIVGGGDINGTVFMNFNMTVESYKKMGADIQTGMTDTQILQAIEDFEDNPPEGEPTPEERIAAALEFNNIINMPEEE